MPGDLSEGETLRKPSPLGRIDDDADHSSVDGVSDAPRTTLDSKPGATADQTMATTTSATGKPTQAAGTASTPERTKSTSGTNSPSRTRTPAQLRHDLLAIQEQIDDIMDVTSVDFKTDGREDDPGAHRKITEGVGSCLI